MCCWVTPEIEVDETELTALFFAADNRMQSCTVVGMDGQEHEVRFTWNDSSLTGMTVGEIEVDRGKLVGYMLAILEASAASRAKLRGLASTFNVKIVP